MKLRASGRNAEWLQEQQTFIQQEFGVGFLREFKFVSDEIAKDFLQAGQPLHTQIKVRMHTVKQGEREAARYYRLRALTPRGERHFVVYVSPKHSRVWDDDRLRDGMKTGLRSIHQEFPEITDGKKLVYEYVPAPSLPAHISTPSHRLSVFDIRMADQESPLVRVWVEKVEETDEYRVIHHLRLAPPVAPPVRIPALEGLQTEIEQLRRELQELRLARRARVAGRPPVARPRRVPALPPDRAERMRKILSVAKESEALSQEMR
jgi:hypothetical protein